MSETFTLESLEATQAVGERLGRALAAGDFVGLTGPLGAGKTALVRAVARGAGVAPEEVTSPTFSILNTYRGPNVSLHHGDLYRLETRDELYATGYFDLLDAEGALLVEWIERIPGATPRDWLSLELAPLPGDGEGRSLRAVAHGKRAEVLLAALRAGR